MTQLRQCLGRPLKYFMKTGLSLIKDVFGSLAKRVLAPLELMAAVSATDSDFQKKIFGLGTKTIIFSNEDVNDLFKRKVLDWEQKH